MLDGSVEIGVGQLAIVGVVSGMGAGSSRSQGGGRARRRLGVHVVQWVLRVVL